jgi:hypothetical protein
MLKALAVLPFICIVAIAVLCIWWKTECEAQRAPCTIEIGPITLRIAGEAKNSGAP